MSISNTNRKAGPFTGNGTASSFPFYFKVFEAADLQVVLLDIATSLETTLTITANYTVSLNANQDATPGGTVTLTAGALASGYKLTITSNIGNLQPTNLTNQGGFYPDVVEDALDRATIQIQQMSETLGRAVTIPISSTASTALPYPQGGTVIGWDDTGSSLINLSPEDIASQQLYANWKYDTFTGDGTTTQFTLQSNPGNIANMDVSVSGVTQLPGADYTLSGTTIAFTTAPALGLSILVRYGQATVQTNVTYSQEVFNVTSGTVDGTGKQTIFNLTSSYSPGNNGISVYVNGSRLVGGTDYTETAATQIVLSKGAYPGDVVLIITAEPINANVSDASQISYTPAGIDAVATNVQAKLRETVSVKDFGADPTATGAENYAAFAAATSYAATNGLDILIPAGSYTLDTNWVISTSGMRVYAEGKVILNFTNAGNCVSIDGGAATTYIFDVHFGTPDNPIWINGNASTTTGLFWRAAHQGSASAKIWNCIIGHRTQFAVSNNFWITVSLSQAVSNVLTPTTGISCERRSAGEDTADNTWFSPIVETVTTSTGHGIYLGYTNRNKFYGGTSEGNKIGLYASSTALGDCIQGLYCEMNTGDAHFDISGTLITLLDCQSTTSSPTPTDWVKIRTGATDCRIIGGDHPSITIDSGAVRTQVIGNAHSSSNTVTDSGTNTTVIQGAAAGKLPFGTYIGGGAAPLTYYSEGTFTAAITCGTSGTITLNSSFNTLGWVKVGRIVTVTGLLIVSGVSSPVGTCAIGNLPFSTDSASSSRAAVSIRATGLAAGAATAIQGKILSADNKIYLEYYAAGVATDLSPRVQASSEFYISATYIAAS